MELTSKEVRAKIFEKKSEISSTKSIYRQKLDILRNRKSVLRDKASLRSSFGRNQTDKAMADIDELEKISNEIHALKKERDEKINSLEKELDELRKRYMKSEGISEKDKNPLAKALSYYKSILISKMSRQSKIAIGASACILLVIILAAIFSSQGVACPKDFIGLTINEATALAEKVGLKSDVWGETYDPDARDEQKVTYVSSVFYADGSQKYGYDKYTDTGIRLMSGEKVSFETEDVTVKQQAKIDECKSNGDNYRYKFKNGKVECYAEETQAEKQAKCEAEGKWYRDGQCKSQEDWELHYQWQDAHAACKKYGTNAYAKTLTDCYVGSDYMGTVDGQPVDNSADSSSEKSSEEQSNPSPSSSTTYNWKQFNSDGSCANDARLCVSIDESYGYASYGYGNVKGRVYNNSGENAKYMQISFSIYNASGAKIGDCFDNTSGLNAGTTWSYDAYCTGWSSGATVSDVDISWW